MNHHPRSTLCERSYTRQTRLQSSARRLALTVLALAAAATPAWALLTIDFNQGALVIVDNGIGDLNIAVGVLDFNTTVANYSLQGTVDVGIAGPNQVALIGSPSANIRLTNFTAEALVAVPGPIDLQFFDTFTGVYVSPNAADSLDAYVGHSGGLPVPPGQDLILNWQGFVSGQIITGPIPGPPPYVNPFLPAASPPLPYTVVGHGPMLLPGVHVNPVVGGYLTFDLTGLGDQLITYSSAEVGFSVVPEPSSVILTSLAAAAVAFRIRRTRK